MPKLRFILCVTTIAAFAAGRILYQLGPYWAGRRGYDAIAQRYELGWVVLVGIVFGIGVLSAVAVGGLLVHPLLGGQEVGRRANWETLAITAAIVVALCLSLGAIRPTNQYFLFGFRGFIEERASLREIREWSCSLSSQESVIPNAEWPPVVSELSPRVVSVESIDGDHAVSLAWGGGFMHWGLTLRRNVGVPGCRPGQHVLEIDDRSYVWVDAQ